MIDINEKLDQLAEYQAMTENLRLMYESARNDILAQVKDQLDELDAEYKPAMNAGQENISELTEEIKQLVLNYGESVKGAHLHAVYGKGAKRWNMDDINSYAKLHPEMEAFRKNGDPSVTIRASK